ncbi:hypothetical protein TPL01_02230 [Sulfuriferula plumbiphila]|uniref:Low-complexity protein n=1 Tax=Sulfuriferula plumbiphila TaxID=171865 RepID=A0A512L3N7_9PROT|nr:low-complexity protein [Sulfuriferula plumbiphila]BBP02791.1 hypothetical protein SFPGR_02130 [Sulfuriferula plumbiphila]GEP29085.1 hypothetical protein TPL01_02230 [Sulfuriferula plumbiphila]
MISKKDVLNAALGGAFVATFSTAAVVNAAQNPFAMQSMDKGYMTADSQMAKDGKAMEGSCGAAHTKANEGNCSGKKKMTKGKEGSHKKMEESKNDANKKAADAPAAM